MSYFHLAKSDLFPVETYEFSVPSKRHLSKTAPMLEKISKVGRSWHSKKERMTSNVVYNAAKC